MHTAFLLAAGLGTRLRPLTLLRPKPIVPIVDTPAIFYLITMLSSQGISRLIINVHYLPGQLCDQVATFCKQLNLELIISFEPQLLGTAGALYKVAPLLMQEPFLLVNADMVMELDLAALEAFHLHHNALATMVLSDHKQKSEYGTIGIDDQHMVIRFVKHVFHESQEHFSGMFCGVHVINPDFIKYIPSVVPCEINRDIYPSLIKNGLPVCGYVYEGPWYEYGDVAHYFDTTCRVLNGSVRNPFTSLRKSTTNESLASPTVYIAPTSQVGPCCKLGPNVVIGSHCVIGKEVTLSNVILWEHITIPDRVTVTRSIIPQQKTILYV